MLPFEGFPNFDASKKLALYVPCAFNHEAMDGKCIVTRVGGKGERKIKHYSTPFRSPWLSLTKTPKKFSLTTGKIEPQSFQG
jgi:hypothetical protein